MVEFSTHIARGLDTMFGAVGESAIYKAAGTGPGTMVTVILSRPDEELSIGRIEGRVPTITAEVRVAEVPNLAKGDTLTVGAEVFKVKGRDRDPLRLIWTLDLQ